MKNKISIFLITYNRIDYLKRTLDEILSESSPIKDFDITVLDNASTDGSSELIDEYSSKHPNLKHIRHDINIGGNANICRAFEYGVKSGKEYVWVLCDDDKYDFSNFSQIKENIENKTDIICTANYAFQNPKHYDLKEFQILQLTFVPSGIYRTELITNNVLMNMYDAVHTMFPQSCIAISAVNQNKKIKVSEKPIVFNGLHFNDACKEISYTRGSSGCEILKRKKENCFILGLINVLTLLNKKKTAQNCIEIAIKDEHIHGGLIPFFYYICTKYLVKPSKINYFIEIFEALNLKLKILTIIYLCTLFIPNCIIYYRKTSLGKDLRIFGKRVKS